MDQLAGRREDLYLVGLVGADVQVAAGVEHDPVRPVELPADRTLGEELDLPGAAVGQDRDAVHGVGRGVRHVEEALVAVEGEAVGPERREPVRLEQCALGPHGAAGAIGRHLRDRSREGVGHVQVAMPVLGDGVGGREARRERRHLVGGRIHSHEPAMRRDAVGEVGHVETLAGLEQLAQQVGHARGPRSDRNLVHEHPTAVDHADRADGAGAEGSRVHVAARIDRDPLRVGTVRLEIGPEVLDGADGRRSRGHGPGHQQNRQTDHEQRQVAHDPCLLGALGTYSSSRTMRAPSASAFSFILATIRGRLRRPQSVVR